MLEFPQFLINFFGTKVSETSQEELELELLDIKMKTKLKEINSILV